MPVASGRDCLPATNPRTNRARSSCSSLLFRMDLATFERYGTAFVRNRRPIFTDRAPRLRCAVDESARHEGAAPILPVRSRLSARPKRIFSGGEASAAPACPERAIAFLTRRSGDGHNDEHRKGPLSIYLRLVDGKVPSIYGPSADEPWM